MTVLSEKFLRDNRSTGDNVPHNFVPWKGRAILKHMLMNRTITKY